MWATLIVTGKLAMGVIGGKLGQGPGWANRGRISGNHAQGYPIPDLDPPQESPQTYACKRASSRSEETQVAYREVSFLSWAAWAPLPQ